jgi:hypothetical protein
MRKQTDKGTTLASYKIESNLAWFNLIVVCDLANGTKNKNTIYNRQGEAKNLIINKDKRFHHD